MCIGCICTYICIATYVYRNIHMDVCMCGKSGLTAWTMMIFLNIVVEGNYQDGGIRLERLPIVLILKHGFC